METKLELLNISRAEFLVKLLEGLITQKETGKVIEKTIDLNTGEYANPHRVLNFIEQRYRFVSKEEDLEMLLYGHYTEYPQHTVHEYIFLMKNEILDYYELVDKKTKEPYGVAYQSQVPKSSKGKFIEIHFSGGK